MSDFKLAQQLKDDTHLLVDGNEFVILLHKNANIPWIIIVPKTDVTEVYELSDGMQATLNKFTKHIANYFKKVLSVEKMNIAAIGNIVSQLHVHVIGRKAGDACWPDVVWGSDYPAIQYSDNQVTAIKAYFKDLLFHHAS